MISMLIYSCKQNEIELLKEISRDIMAFRTEERLEIMTFDNYADIDMKAIENVDLAYVDITDEHGLQVAKDLRAGFSDVEILIISDPTISPMVYLTPTVRAASLLLKPLNTLMIQTSVKELFDSLQLETVNDVEYFSFDDEKEKRRIPYSNIVYFEARNRRVYIRVQNKEYGIYATLDTLEGELPDCFKRCHRSYIINTSYISKVWYSQNMILLSNDEEIPLSRSYKTVIKEVVKGEN